MDFYDLFWGLLKYVIPVILFIISVLLDNMILLVISLLWIMSSIFMAFIVMDNNRVAVF